jgi:hypothetical protein
MYYFDVSAFHQSAPRNIQLSEYSMLFRSQPSAGPVSRSFAFGMPTPVCARDVWTIPAKAPSIFFNSQLFS